MGVVAEEDDDLSQVVGGEVADPQAGAGLEAGHVVLAPPDEQPDQEQPPVPQRQPRPGPDLGEEVLGGQTEPVPGPSPKSQP